MSATLPETPNAEKSGYVKITVEDARRLRSELLEMRRLALKFAQRALDSSKILDLVINESVDK